MIRNAEKYREIIQKYSGYPYTPDVHVLCKGPGRLLFVHDEWLSDRRQNFVLDNIGEKLTSAFTKEYYEFLIHTPSETALAFPSEHGRRIKGELWIVLSEAFISLDKLKLNGVHFIRERVEVLDPFRPIGYVDNGYFTEDGLLLPEALQGKKHWIGDERVWIHDAYMYTAHPKLEALVYKEPYNFERVPYFPPKKEKQWLSEYHYFQHQD